MRVCSFSDKLLFQLPPTQKNHGGKTAPRFLFQSQSWAAAVPRCVLLTQGFRQSGDQSFAKMLDKLRKGIVTHEMRMKFEAAADTDLSNDSGVRPTKLYSKNEEVDFENYEELRKLSGFPVSFQSTEWATQQRELDRLDKNCQWPRELELKVGAQVMLLKNLDVSGGLVNGSRGVVTAMGRQAETGIETIGNVPDEPGSVSRANEETGGARLQSVQKYQFDKDDDEESEIVVVVRFLSGRVVHISREIVELRDANGRVVARRTQFPLRLAWAITIHKSQGQTYDIVEVNLRGCFEDGQVNLIMVLQLDLHRTAPCRKRKGHCFA